MTRTEQVCGFESHRAPDLTPSSADVDRKAFCQTLNQLHLPTELDPASILKLDLLTSHLAEQCPLNNPAIEKIFARFKAKVAQQYAEQLKDLDPGLYVDRPDVLQVYEAIAVDPPKGSVAPPPPKRQLEVNGGNEEEEKEVASAAVSCVCITNRWGNWADFLY